MVRSGSIISDLSIRREIKILTTIVKLKTIGLAKQVITGAFVNGALVSGVVIGGALMAGAAIASKGRSEGGSSCKTPKAPNPADQSTLQQ